MVSPIKQSMDNSTTFSGLETSGPDFSPFISFGEEKRGDSRRREHISYLSTPRHESVRKKLLSFVKDVTWNQSRRCSGVSVAHLYHQKKPKLMIGLLKMEPKSVKHTQFSGPVCHRFVVLLGEVNIRINESSLYRDYGVNTIIRIGSQTTYSIENIQNDDTYLFFKSVTSDILQAY